MKCLLLILTLTACATTEPPKESEPEQREPCNVAPGRFIDKTYSLGAVFHRYRAQDGAVYSCPLDMRCYVGQRTVPGNKFINDERCVAYCACTPEYF